MYKCVLCKRDDFKDVDALRSHRNSQRKTGKCPKKYDPNRIGQYIRGKKCIKCERAFGTEKEARQHVADSLREGHCKLVRADHLKKSSYICKRCKVDFLNAYHLGKHKKECTRGSEEDEGYFIEETAKRKTRKYIEGPKGECLWT